MNKTLQAKPTKPRTQLHGLLLVDKPVGMTSHDVVSRVRRIAETKEVGHSGTLDPLASGLMVVLLGEATKLSSIVTEGDKAYEVQVQFGIATDTLDITGQIQKTADVHVTKMQVVAQALALAGEFELAIPLYSAKKINGQKLYEYARNNEHVEIPTKIMKFWDVRYISDEESEKENRYRFALECSKGSFIRSWVKELGDRLDCPATMSALRRTKSHDFQLAQATDLNVLLEQRSKNIDSFKLEVLPIEQAISGVRVIKVSGQDEVLLNNGQISHDLRSRLIISFKPDVDQWVFVISARLRQVIAIIGLEPGVGFKIKRVFKY